MASNSQNPVVGQIQTTVCPTTEKTNTSIYAGGTSAQNYGWVSIAATQYSQPGYITNAQGSTVFYTKDGRQVSVDELVDFMTIMKQRMLLLTPVFEKHEHYPALKAAYEQYLLIERMCLGDGGA